MREQYVYVPATIRRGAFSAERLIRIAEVDGREYCGGITSAACCDRHGVLMPLPRSGEQLNGYVRGVLVGQQPDSLMVVLSNAEAVQVPLDGVLQPEHRLVPFKV